MWTRVRDPLVASRQYRSMSEHADELASTLLVQRAQRLSRLSARHPFAVDLAIVLVTAALSIANLTIQQRLDTLAVVFCAALCAPLLARRRLSPFLCFAAIAAIAFAQWLLAPRSWPTPRC